MESEKINAERSTRQENMLPLPSVDALVARAEDLKVGSESENPTDLKRDIESKIADLRELQGSDGFTERDKAAFTPHIARLTAALEEIKIH